MLRAQQAVLSNVISLTQSIDEVKALGAALNSDVDVSPAVGNMPLGDIATLKAVCLESEVPTSELDKATLADPAQRSTVDQSSQGLQDVSESQIAGFQPVIPNGLIGMATLEGRNVLVEWKKLASAHRWKLIKSVQQLAQILHVPTAPSFRSLRCFGLAMGEAATKAGFIFQLPHDNIRHAVSLREILSGKIGSIAPSIGARLKLALALLRSLQYFHNAGWMHKNLRSENVLFLRRVSASEASIADADLESPYLVGFGYARLDLPGQISERPSIDPSRDIYRHPHALSGMTTSFQPTMDLYSIGTVLIELAEWRPLSTLVKEVVDVKTDAVHLTQLTAVRAFLCHAAVDGSRNIKVDFRMGARYARAVRLCLCVETASGIEISKGRSVAEMDNTLATLGAAVEELQACVI